MPNRRLKADEQLLQRVRAEFFEMPGLRLTHDQARRLWGLSDEACTLVLSVLVEAKFLSRDADGRYSRLTEGRLPAGAPRVAKADLLPRTHSKPTAAGKRTT